MITIRRKLQTYPVAFAVALLIATSARAQLCLTAATNSGDAGFTVQTDIAASSVKASAQNTAGPSSMIAQPVQVATNDVPAHFAPALLPEVASACSLPQPAAAQNTPETSNHARDDVVRELLLAASQPALAEASLQPMFAD
jgi:hypothetical protein